MAIKAYSPWGKGEFINYKSAPDLEIEYKEHPWDNYKDTLTFSNRHQVLAEITGTNVAQTMRAILDGSSKKHRKLIREYLDFADAGFPDDFKWSEPQ